MAFAAVVGRFIGAVLDECGPQIVRLIRACFTNTAEDSKPPDSVRDGVLDSIDKLRDKHKDGLYKADPTVPTPGEDKGR